MAEQTAEQTQVIKADAPKSALTTRQRMIKQAFAKLSPEDQAIIEKAASDLQVAVKAGHPYTRFTHDNALEVLSCIGMLSIKRKGLLKA